jgi:hypothetical protein
VNKIWQALAHEAGLAAEHIGIGATAIGKANYAEHAYYAQAFFALTTGFERASKLALVIDYALENRGDFPPNRVLRRYGHDLSSLLDKVNEIAKDRQLFTQLPSTDIHKGIIKVLSYFANNITRYYNIDYVTENPKTKGEDDPVKSWFELVIIPILGKHQTQRQRHKIQRNAQLVDELIGSHAIVVYHVENGAKLDTVYEASCQTGIIDLAKPYTRMYVLQIARFIGNVLSELGYAAYGVGLDTIPHLSEFFAIFNNEDKYFLKRKTWSIYRT